MGVEPDTTMRNRQPRPNSDTHNNFQAPAAPVCGTVPFERIFRPDELDLDDLAEAIRLLLGRDIGPQSTSTDRPDAHLLSVPRRGTHVVEATGTH